MINTVFSLEQLVARDNNRIARLFSNLLSNAIKYGRDNQPVQAIAKSRDGEFVLSVCNGAIRSRDDVMIRLFERFSPGKVRPGQQGLGLGMYISAEIAKAHDGRINVISGDKETRFTFSMPSQPPACCSCKNITIV